MTLNVSLSRILVLGALALSLTQVGFAREVRPIKQKIEAVKQKVQKVQVEECSSSSSSSSSSSTSCSSSSTNEFTVYEFAGLEYEIPLEEALDQKTLDGFGN